MHQGLNQHKEFVNIEDEVILAMRKRYIFLHSLLFLRSVEKARSRSELFDILDTVPAQFPLTWNDDLRRWITVDLF